jgi:hypothetical protein
MQTDLIAALQNPALYPHPVHGFRVLETHISWVILTGTRAYKIKKPVDLGFLNFSTLELRRHYCEEELRLNRRFAPDLYLDVVAITGTVQAPQINGAGPAIEYAVRMREFDQAARVDISLAREPADPTLFDALAETIARFHCNAPRSDGVQPFGTPEAVWAPIAENFTQIRQHEIAAEIHQELALLERWSKNTFARLRAQLQARKDEGFIRECHGDLHTRNLVRLDEAIVPFDCIEFNPNLRWIDIVSEIAFLKMDLDATGHPELARRALNAWLEHNGDYAGVALLPFYLCYRALVRAKVAITQAENAVAAERTQMLDEFERYVALARRYTQPAHPFLLVMHGLSGSGKSTLSLQLVEQLGVVRVRSDVERKRMFDLAPHTRSESGINTGIYTAQTTDAVYRRLLQLAELMLSAGFGAVLDATYLRRSQRDAAFELARRLKVPCVLVDCQAPKDTLARLIEQRARGAADASEADLRVLERQIATQEPLTETERARAVVADARAPFDLDRIRRQLACLTSTPAIST